MSKLVIIDGYSLLFRAYYATAYKGEDTILRTSDGTPINAIFTFANMILPLLASLNKNDSILVALDTGKETNRQKEYKDYKANRSECPESLKVQIPLLRDFLDSLNIHHFEKVGYEADDIAGSFAKLASLDDITVEIYTSDKDYLQLVDKNISINLLKKGMKEILKVTENNFYDNFEIYPDQIRDYKGLRGDSSDNLKGIPGIGEKTAITLLNQFGTLENIVNSANLIKGKLKDKIIEYKDQGFLCKKLATIDTNIEIPFTVKDCTFNGINLEKANIFINKYEMKSLINKISNIDRKIENNQETNENLIFKKVEFLPKLSSNEIGFSLNYDYKSNYHTANIEGFFISDKTGNYYIDYNDAKKDDNFKKVMQNINIFKNCFDSKSISYVLKKMGICLQGVKADILLCSYLLNSNNSTDPKTVFLFFNKLDINLDLSQFNSCLLIAKYSNELSNLVIKKLTENNDYELYKTIELPLSETLSDMEYEGFPIDRNSLISIGEKYKEKINCLTKDIYNLAQEEFNIDSPKQVANILFDKLQLKKNKKSSTSIDYLKYLYDEHPIVPLLLEYRKYAKLYNTYVKGIISYIQDDNKIHCIFNQAITSTGRLSSSEPNMQNITIRDQESKEIRKAFLYENPLYNILSFDYSQIELRILASLSGCKNLIKAFNDGIDVHTHTAQLIFGKTDISEAERRKAKAVNFGIVYGISDYGLKEQIDVSISEAKEIISNFYKNYPEIKTYMEKQIKFAEEKGYVETLFNRKRYIPEINSSDYNKREFAKRAASNAPIQGSAADIIKIVMIKISNLLKNYDSKLILQIHDELIFKLNLNELDELLPKIKQIMENSINLQVKLKVDGGYAKDWYSVK